MIDEQQPAPTKTLDYMAQAEALLREHKVERAVMEPLEPGDVVAVDEQVPVEIPDSFVAYVDEDGRKMYRIPWGAEMAALAKAMRAIARKQKSLRRPLPVRYSANKKLAKKTADASRRRNRK